MRFEKRTLKLLQRHANKIHTKQAGMLGGTTQKAKDSDYDTLLAFSRRPPCSSSGTSWTHMINRALDRKFVVIRTSSLWYVLLWFESLKGENGVCIWKKQSFLHLNSSEKCSFTFLICSHYRHDLHQCVVAVSCGKEKETTVFSGGLVHAPTPTDPVMLSFVL